ncbi:ExbD/TolR family protein [Yoonia sp. 2307UL14-13]|uniref:ExbD/TolR family protein n=1 Tax=Yoonia sp. 2307UL14-13 TaxID=3126506 RepID=UPI0030B3FF5A
MQVRPRARLPMTSLIDVIFLLLLFFMLTSTFSRFGEIPITLGGTGANAASSDTAPLFVRITVNGPSLNGTNVASADLADQISERSDSPPRILVTATSEASAQSLAETLHALRAIPDAQIVVLN